MDLETGDAERGFLSKLVKKSKLITTGLPKPKQFPAFTPNEYLAAQYLWDHMVHYQNLICHVTACHPHNRRDVSSWNTAVFISWHGQM